MDRLKRLLASRTAMIVLAIGLGLVNTHFLFGWYPIRPTNIDWIFGDNATYYAGWALYRQDPHLHFPLTWTDRIGYPVGTSIALLDAIPLVAILLRPLSPLLPEPFQYLGLFSAACFILQAYFGLSLCRRLFPSHPGFARLGGAFFLVSAPLTWRAFGHTALLSHWLILAALDGYFRDLGERPVAWMRRLWIVLALSAAITPYVAAMCCLVVFAGVGRVWLAGKIRWWHSGVLVAVTLGVMIGTQVLVGVLVDRDASAYFAPGYGLFSMNLNAPVNAMDQGSIALPQLPTYHPGQLEGYNYLGLGIIALLGLGLLWRPLSIVWLGDRRLLPLLALGLACTALAVSTSVSFGSSLLFEIQLPKAIMSLLYTLRASGRLFWPAYYLLFLAALSLTYWGWKDPYRSVLLAVALVVQIADLHAIRTTVHGVVARDLHTIDPLQSPAWKGLGRKYDDLVLIPPFECSPFTGAGGYYSFVWFGKLAAAEHMRTNSYYAARYTKHQVMTHCVTLLRSQLQGTLDPRSAYVVTDGVRTAWQLAGVRSHTCEAIDGFNLCTPVAASDAALTPPPIPPPPLYTLSDEIDFKDRGNGHQYTTVGWGLPSSDGTWTEGPLAMLRLGVTAPIDPSRPLLIDFVGQPFVVAPQHPRLYVDVVVNGQTIDQWIFRAGAVTRRRSARIPTSAVGDRRELTIEFRFQNPEAPLYLGAGPLPYFLGLNVRRITVQYE